MQRALVSLCLAALLAPAASGQGTASSIERFKLFNACRPVEFLIEPFDGDEATIGLTRAALQAAAESRLRRARLYTELFERPDAGMLIVNVGVAARAFRISVQYLKVVTDEFGESAPTPTWSSSSFGVASNAGFIVSSLSQHLDRFLAAYLRVNEEACGTPAGRP